MSASRGFPFGRKFVRAAAGVGVFSPLSFDGVECLPLADPFLFG